TCRLAESSNDPIGHDLRLCWSNLSCAVRVARSSAILYVEPSRASTPLALTGSQHRDQSIAVHMLRLKAVASDFHIAITAVGMTPSRTVSLKEGRRSAELNGKSFTDFGVNLSVNKIPAIFTSRRRRNGSPVRRRKGVARDPIEGREFGSRQRIRTVEGA